MRRRRQRGNVSFPLLSPPHHPMTYMLCFVDFLEEERRKKKEERRSILKKIKRRDNHKKQRTRPLRACLSISFKKRMKNEE